MTIHKCPECDQPKFTAGLCNVCAMWSGDDKEATRSRELNEMRYRHHRLRQIARRRP